MPEPKALVTDTHPLIFHAAGGRRLGAKAARHFAACERGAALLYVPAVVVWECALLARRRRVEFGRSVESFFTDLFGNPAFQPLDLTLGQLYLADEARPNEDPFDALICAAARALDLPLITADADITDSGLVRVVW
ncbi:MAG: type II toxin-antitoxin system VapC family toxin [Deltaproteobacteria bacterium]|nr:type II toxin-antitoxin system VapC family toxin [Deltaproteobacteria bacterium]